MTRPSIDFMLEVVCPDCGSGLPGGGICPVCLVESIITVYPPDTSPACQCGAVLHRLEAQQRKDAQMEAWVSEIKARAWVRIGEISAALEKNPGAGGHNRKARPSNGTSVKAAELKRAGISKSSAQRAERLAAPESREALQQFLCRQCASTAIAAANAPVLQVDWLEAAPSPSPEAAA